MYMMYLTAHHSTLLRQKKHTSNYLFAAVSNYNTSNRHLLYYHAMLVITGYNNTDDNYLQVSKVGKIHVGRPPFSDRVSGRVHP